MSEVVLEPVAQAFAEAASKPPFIHELSPVEARRVLDDVQAAPVEAPAVDDQWLTVTAAVGDVRIRVVRPHQVTGVLPVVLYVHGGGWVLGNAGTHDRLGRFVRHPLPHLPTRKNSRRPDRRPHKQRTEEK